MTDDVFAPPDPMVKIDLSISLPNNYDDECTFANMRKKEQPRKKICLKKQIVFKFKVTNSYSFFQKFIACP